MKNISVILTLISALTAFSAWADDAPVVNLSVKGGHFSPEKVEAPAGEKFQLVVKNEGPGAEEFESSDLNREKVIAPGKTLTIFLGPLNPGSYKFVGEYHEDTAKGMIVVK